MPVSSSTPRRRWCAASHTWLAIVLALVVGCAGSRERWAEVPFHGLSFQNLYLSMLDLLDMEGYRVLTRNPGGGTIESEWQYGTSRREVRGPARRKVHVEIVAGDDGDFRVRVRVAEQIIRKGGMLATGVTEHEDWEDFPDNFEDAEYLAAKVRALLGDYVGASSERPSGSPR